MNKCHPRKAIAMVVSVAIGLSCTPSAFAQSNVTLYGIVDGGIAYVTNTARIGGKNKSSAQMITGGAANDRFGFKGSENLGGGIEAIFQLENGFNVSNGTLQQGGRLFGRQAFVGLQTPYGTLTLGRQKVPIYDYFQYLDPLGYYGWSLVSQDAQYANRADNSIKYVATVGPFSFDWLYSTGYDATIANGVQVPGEFRVGQELSAGASYSSGPFLGAAVYDLRHGTSEAAQGDKEQRVTIGASYQIISAVKVFAGYKWFNSSILATAARSDMYYGGLQFNFRPDFFVSAATYYTDFKSGQHPLDFGVNTAYLLSKRTKIYGDLNFVKNSHNSQLGVAGYGSGVVAGANQTGIGFGINQLF